MIKQRLSSSFLDVFKPRIELQVIEIMKDNDLFLADD